MGFDVVDPTLDCAALLFKATPIAAYCSQYIPLEETIEDIQVNSLWQRLRKNLLLLLQLLFVLALIIACLRPGFRRESSTGDRIIFLLDNSASMQSNGRQGESI